MKFGTQLCGDLAQAAEREWLVTDGLGGYAMGTVSGLRTRRYHGLLVVSGAPTGQRRVALAALDPVVTLASGSVVRLGTHEWTSGAIAPAGHTLLESFELRDGHPVWRWRIGSVVVERELALRPGEATLGVVHRVLAGGPVTLAVEPLCTWRDAHAERYQRDGLAVEPAADGFVVEGAYRVSGPSFQLAAEWYLGAFHREERDRGLAATEDLLRVGRFTRTLDVGQTLEISAWAGDAATLGREPPPAMAVVTEASRRARLMAGSPDSDDGTLRLAADAFIVRSATGAPERRGRLPVVRDLVAGHDDLLRRPLSGYRTGR